MNWKAKTIKGVKLSINERTVPLDSINQAVIEKVCDRAVKGFQTYGVTMDRDDLGMLNWLQHLQEEMLDACIYIEKILHLKEDRQPPEYPPE